METTTALSFTTAHQKPGGDTETMSMFFTVYGLMQPPLSVVQLTAPSDWLRHVFNTEGYCVAARTLELLQLESRAVSPR